MIIYVRMAPSRGLLTEPVPSSRVQSRPNVFVDVLTSPSSHCPALVITIGGSSGVWNVSGF